RGERADREHLQIGELPLVHGELREIPRFLTGAVALRGGHEQVDERASVGRDRVGIEHVRSRFLRGRALSIAVAPEGMTGALQPHGPTRERGLPGRISGYRPAASRLYNRGPEPSGEGDGPMQTLPGTDSAPSENARFESADP